MRRSRRSCATPSRPELIRGDYVDLLPGLLAERAGGRAHGRLPDRLDRLSDAASATTSCARSLERRGSGRAAAGAGSRRAAVTRRRRRPRTAGSSSSASGRSRARLVALVDFHGNWIDWLDGVISSKDNPKLKLVRALQRKKERDETGLFACEGEDLCDAALEAGHRAGRAADRGRERRGRAARGRVDAAAPAARDRRLSPADLPVGLRETCLALWQLSDPGNVGTLIRSADAFGAAVSLSARLRRSALAEGAAGERGGDLPGAARAVGRAARPSGGARRGGHRLARRGSISRRP